MIKIRRNCPMTVPLFLCEFSSFPCAKVLALRYSSRSMHSIPITRVRNPYITQCAHLSANCMFVSGNSCAGIRLSVAISRRVSRVNICRLIYTIGFRIFFGYTVFAIIVCGTVHGCFPPFGVGEGTLYAVCQILAIAVSCHVAVLHV